MHCMKQVEIRRRKKFSFHWKVNIHYFHGCRYNVFLLALLSSFPPLVVEIKEPLSSWQQCGR